MANPSYIYNPYRAAGGDSSSPLNYFEMLLPASVRRIQEEARSECRRLDHPGSILYDEYPDKEALLYLVDTVYDRILNPSNAFTDSGMFLPIEETRHSMSSIRPADSTTRDEEGRAPFLSSPLYDLVKMIVLQEIRNLLAPL